MHPGKIGAGHVESQRCRPRRKHQFRERKAFFIGDLEFAATDIDLRGDAAVFQGDAASAPPIGGEETTVTGGGPPGSNEKKQHGLKGNRRFVADPGMAEGPRGTLASSSTRRV